MGSDSESNGDHELQHAAIGSAYAQYPPRYGVDSEADSDASCSSSMFLGDYWPHWSPELPEHPDFVACMPEEPTASHAYSAQEDPELTAALRLWLQTSNAWNYI
ncbi:hypothetical protein ABBQ32_011234 [Trebouxia sp. C0010 RCD-2024]